jgi:hypothetical protein
LDLIGADDVRVRQPQEQLPFPEQAGAHIAFPESIRPDRLADAAAVATLAPQIIDIEIATASEKADDVIAGSDGCPRRQRRRSVRFLALV